MNKYKLISIDRIKGELYGVTNKNKQIILNPGDKFIYNGHKYRTGHQGNYFAYFPWWMYFKALRFIAGIFRGKQYTEKDFDYQFMVRDEDIISYDFQGWPNYKMTLREILKSLGANTNKGVIGFREKDPILDVYPKVLEDDGMGYGVNARYITEASVDKEDKSFISIFAEPEIEDENTDE